MPTSFFLRWSCLALALLLVCADDIFAQQSSSDFDDEYLLLKSGRRLEGAVQIEVSGGGYQTVVYNDSLTYPLRDVRAFTRGGEYLVNHGVVKGKGELKEKLLMRLNEGRLALYSEYNGNASQGSIEYFSKQDGQIEALTYANVRPAVQDHPPSLQLAETSRKWKWVRDGLLVTGASCWATAWASRHSN